MSMEMQVEQEPGRRKSRQGEAQPDRDAFWQFCKYASARAKGLGGTLTAHDLDKLFVDQQWRCAVSGIQFDRTGWLKGKRTPFGPGLDRIVAGGPYEVGNVRLVCNIVNFAMNEWGEEALYRLVKEMRIQKMTTVDMGNGIPTITINMDKPCAECGRKGAAPSGLCMSCTTKAIGTKPMRSAAGLAVRARFRENVKRG